MSGIIVEREPIEDSDKLDVYGSIIGSEVDHGVTKVINEFEINGASILIGSNKCKEF